MEHFFIGTNLIFQFTIEPGPEYQALDLILIFFVPQPTV